METEATFMEITLINLSYKIKTQKQGYKKLLKNLNGCFHTGELTAIMGPSGAGKTTLLNILTGSSKHTNGKVLINGVVRNIKEFRQQSSYITQDSELFPLLTVMESMYIASCLKLPLNTPQQDKIDAIISILASLGLEECLDIRAGNLSGGERKRLFIALELLSDHPIIFLDEPTSGLDTVSANQCVSVLKSLSENGKMVVITIHQPSAFILEKFDHLYFLSQGQCFYQGPVIKLVPYLQTFGLNCPKYHNPADYAIEIACLEHGENIVDQLAKSVSLEFQIGNRILRKNNNCEMACEITNTGPLTDLSKISNQETLQNFRTFLNQVKVLLKRYFMCLSRDLIQLYLVLLAYSSCGVFVGLLYYGKGYYADDALANFWFLQLCALVLIFGGILFSVIFFPLEFIIFKREYINGWYKLISYFLAKTFIDVPTQILFTFIFLIIVYVLSAQPMEIWRFLGIFLFGILGILNSHVVGILIGIIFGIKSGAYMGAIYLIIAALFSGAFLPFKDTANWVYWVSHLNYLKYLWQGFNAVIFYGRDVLPCHEDTVYCHFKYTKKLYLFFGIEQANIGICILAMTILWILKLILTYFVLKYKTRKV